VSVNSECTRDHINIIISIFGFNGLMILNKSFHQISVIKQYGFFLYFCPGEKYALINFASVDVEWTITHM